MLFHTFLLSLILIYVLTLQIVMVVSRKQNVFVEHLVRISLTKFNGDELNMAGFGL